MKGTSPPEDAGRKLLAVRISKQVFSEFKKLSVDLDRDMYEVAEEALKDVIRKYKGRK